MDREVSTAAAAAAAEVVEHDVATGRTAAVAKDQDDNSELDQRCTVEGLLGSSYFLHLVHKMSLVVGPFLHADYTLLATSAHACPAYCAAVYAAVSVEVAFDSLDQKTSDP